MNKPIYCPILRFKRGEQNALKNLEDHIKNQVLPLLVITSHEFNPDDGELYDKTFDSHLTKDAKSLVSAWNGFPAYVDLGGINSDAVCEGNVSFIEYFFEHLFKYDELFDVKPVISLGSDDKNILANMAVCKKFGLTPVFRVTPDDLGSVDYKEFVKVVLEESSCDVKDCDIILDMGYIETTGRTAITARGALQALPFYNEWASITLAGGSFPENLSGFVPGKHVVPRNEWGLWLSERNSLGREIRYGDYATIHPVIPEEEIDPRTINPSASVRYTFQDSWILIRGTGVKKTHPDALGFSQFFEHAHLICTSSEYRNEEFSYGDKLIASINRKEDGKSGNLETWVTIGVNHHITEIIYQLSSLS